MTDKLETIKEALEDILNDYKYNIKEYQLAQERNGPLGFLLNITGKTRAKQALAELNSYMEARDSEDMVEKVAFALWQQETSGSTKEQYEEDCVEWCKNNLRQKAKAAIKAMEDGE